MDRPVDGREAQTLRDIVPLHGGFDGPVHGATQECDVLRDTHVERHPNVAIANVVAAPGSGLTRVLTSSGRRIDRAHRHAFIVLDDFNLYLTRVASAPASLRPNLDLRTRSPLSDDGPVHALDLYRLPCPNGSVPHEVGHLLSRLVPVLPLSRTRCGGVPCAILVDEPGNRPTHHGNHPLGTLYRLL